MAKNQEDENQGADDDVIVVQEAMKISDGVHTGNIANVVHEKRGEAQQFDYIDVYIETVDDNENEVTIKTGFPAYLTENSSFGKFLAGSGFDFEAGDNVTLTQIKKHLIGKTIAFQTLMDEQFARVINKSVKFT